MSIWKFDLLCDLVTSSMTSWICIYINVVIISRYLCTGSFVMISFLVSSYHEKFIKEYRGPTLKPPCDVIDDVMVMKILFFAKFRTIFLYLRSDWSCVKYFKIFKMAAILSSRQNFYLKLYRKDSHEHFRHFELLMDAIAQILTEIYQFQNLTYFVILWRHQWRHECVKHNLHN